MRQPEITSHELQPALYTPHTAATGRSYGGQATSQALYQATPRYYTGAFEGPVSSTVAGPYLASGGICSRSTTVSGKTMGRKDRLWGQIGVNRMAGTQGCTWARGGGGETTRDTHSKVNVAHVGQAMTCLPDVDRRGHRVGPCIQIMRIPTWPAAYFAPQQCLAHGVTAALSGISRGTPVDGWGEGVLICCLS